MSMKAFPDPADKQEHSDQRQRDQDDQHDGQIDNESDGPGTGTAQFQPQIDALRRHEGAAQRAGFLGLTSCGTASASPAPFRRGR